MAFVVEDGTGISNANAYITVAYFRAYFTDRGVDLSALTDDQVQAYIVRATDFVEKRFGQRYAGTRKTLVQSLGMPRTGIILDGVTISPDAVPAMFQMGIAEYAKRASIYAELSPDSPVPFSREGTSGSPVPAAGVVTEESKKVGPIEKSVKYADPTTLSTTWAIPAYPAADALIEPFLTGSKQGRTIRA
jgi:hypothetical protein